MDRREHPLNAVEASAADANSLADLQIRVRLKSDLLFDYSLQRVNLSIGNRSADTAGPDEASNTVGAQDGDTITKCGRKSHKNVAGK